VSIGSRSREGKIHQVVAMSLGSGISGWVAANGKAVVNSDANLDLPSELSRFRASRCLAVPIHLKGDTVGVLSAYMDDQRGFSERDVVLMEGIARSVESSPIAKLVESVLSSAHLKPARPSTTVH